MPDVVVTGIPRSGTTLVCHLLNHLPDVVALHEPLDVSALFGVADRAAMVDVIAEFLATERRRAIEDGVILTKHVDGRVPDDPVIDKVDRTGRLKPSAVRGIVPVGKPLSTDFTLVCKHNAVFTALLDQLAPRFPVYAVVRNPLATLGSWNSVAWDIRSGHAQGAERVDQALADRLSAIPDSLDRQIALLDWFHGQYLRHLPAEAILRYEQTVASGGSSLAVIHPSAAALAEPLGERNLSERHDRAFLLRAAERLLRAEGAFWETYPRASVEALAEMVAAGQ